MVQAPRQQSRGEDPSLTQSSLLSPALSVEAWDPAITSTWVRLPPLPGSTPSTVLGPTCQGLSGILGYLRGSFMGQADQRGPQQPSGLEPPPLHSPLISTVQKGYRSPCPAWVQFTNRLSQSLAPSPWCAHSSQDPPLQQALGPSTCQVSSKPSHQGPRPPPHHCPGPPGAHLGTSPSRNFSFCLRPLNILFPAITRKRDSK